MTITQLSAVLVKAIKEIGIWKFIGDFIGLFLNLPSRLWKRAARDRIVPFPLSIPLIVYETLVLDVFVKGAISSIESIEKLNKFILSLIVDPDPTLVAGFSIIAFFLLFL